jgi:hypothetical protein
LPTAPTTDHTDHRVLCRPKQTAATAPPSTPLPACFLPFHDHQLVRRGKFASCFGAFLHLDLRVTPRVHGCLPGATTYSFRFVDFAINHSSANNCHRTVHLHVFSSHVVIDFKNTERIALIAIPLSWSERGTTDLTDTARLPSALRSSLRLADRRYSSAVFRPIPLAD